MRVLVTGAAGYIGSVLVPQLERAGHDVRGLDLGLYEASTFGAGSPRTERRDIRDLAEADLEGFDAVIALAALSNDPLGDLSPNLTYEINRSATTETARLAKRVGVERFVFASSCSLYGAAGADSVDESGQMAPVTPYGRSKALVEEDLRSIADDNFSPTYLRNATVYGSSPSLRLDVVVNNLTAWAVATGKIVLISDGTPWRPQVHVRDVARAFSAVLLAPKEVVHNESFNVGRNDQNFQVRDIAEMVRQQVSGSVLEMPERIDSDSRSYRVEFSKLANQVPEAVPEYDVVQGIRELVEAFGEYGLAEGDFDRFTRLAEINRLVGLGEISEELRWL